MSDRIESNDLETNSTFDTLDESLTTTTESIALDAPQGSFPFEAMNLKVGDRLQAQPHAKFTTERCFVRLIGFLNGRSILITTPKTSNDVRLQLIEGDQLVIRAFSGQNAFGFSSDVQRVCKLPYSYLHVSFPSSVQGTVIRKAPRVRTKIIANVLTGQASGELTGVISNLSANGALLDAHRDMAEEGDQICLGFRLKLHNIETKLSLNAVVRAILDDEALRQSGSSLAHFGLEFVDPLPNDLMLLKSMVYQKMVEEPQSLT